METHATESGMLAPVTCLGLPLNMTVVLATPSVADY
jgi:hypothetical protein